MLMLCACISCTENQKSESHVERVIVDLPTNTKLVNVTWRSRGELWYLTRPLHENEKPETFTFRETSESLGYGRVEERQIIFKESK